ncbi:MAG: hypothetical protein HYZ15_10565 [Sphingobacteriales bacterium]|nr:hypothetical protein [Sphingobacteriales bacterium]
MTSKILTIFFLLASTIAFSQTDKAKKDSATKLVLADTVKANKSDTIYITKDRLVDKELRIVLEETNRPDYFKYILPILTLLLGIGINKYLDYLKDRKQIKKTGERWKAELTSLEMPITKQIQYLEDFLAEHNKEVFGVPKLSIVTSLDCEVFSSLGKTDFIKFIQSSLSKDYKDSVIFSSKVSSFISIVKSNTENVRLKFNEYLDGTSSHTTKLSLGLQELLIEFADFGVKIEKEVNGDPIQHPGYAGLLELFDNEIAPKLQTGDYDIYELEKKFFLPLFNLLGHMRLDDRTKKMADIASGCMSSIKGIKMEKKYLSENITTLISHYKDDVKDLNEILTELN